MPDRLGHRGNRIQLEIPRLAISAVERAVSFLSRATHDADDLNLVNECNGDSSYSRSRFGALAHHEAFDLRPDHLRPRDTQYGIRSEGLALVACGAQQLANFIVMPPELGFRDDCGMKIG